MDTLGQFLDDREARRSGPGVAADEAKAAEAWAMAGASPEERLVAFDQWVRAQLVKRLVWPENEAARERLIHQCRAELERALIEMFDRGWLIDGRRLARHVAAMLEPIGKAQRAGSVGDFWPYFSAAVRRYPRMNAEAIQREAKSIGAQMGITVAALVQASGKARSEMTIGEITQQRRDETIKERAARHRREQARKAEEARQMDLL